MRKSFFKTDNFHAVMKALEVLKNRDPSLPGLGVIYGKYGLGKSETVQFIYGLGGILYVLARAIWSVRDLLEGICDELGIRPAYRTTARFNEITDELRRRGEPLIIDESDYLARKPLMLDTIKDLHEATRVPIILVGTEELPGKLQRHGQLWSRVLPAGIVEFRPLSASEFGLIVDAWTGLKISPKAAEKVCDFAGGDFRYLVGYLLEFERLCKLNKTQEITVTMVTALMNKFVRKKRVKPGRSKALLKDLHVVGGGA